MMSKTTQHEQLRHAFEYFARRPATASEVECVETEMPTALHYITMARGVGADTYLRFLPDDLLTKLSDLAIDFLQKADRRDFYTWDA